MLFPSQLPHAFLLLQLFQNDQIKLRIKLAKILKKLKRNLSFFVFVRIFLMKTILTSFDFMQNFDLKI